MTITELSAATGVPVPTIRFYLRNGLLAPGDPASPGEDHFGPKHVERLKLVRAMLEVGGVPVTETRAALRHIDAADEPVHSAFGRVTRSWDGPGVDIGNDDEMWNEARREVTELVERRHWRTGPYNPAWQALTQTIVTCRWLGVHDLLCLLDQYAETAERMADADLSVVAGRGGTDSMLEGAVLWEVLGEALFTAMRRMAHESASARLFADQSGKGHSGQRFSERD